MGFARLAEQSIKKARGIAEGDKLGTMDRVAASTIGGALGCWNQPIEVVRVEVNFSLFSILDEFLVLTFFLVKNLRCNLWLRTLQLTDLLR